MRDTQLFFWVDLSQGCVLTFSGSGEGAFPEPKLSASPDHASSWAPDLPPESTASASEPFESLQESTSTSDRTPLEPPVPKKTHCQN